MDKTAPIHRTTLDLKDRLKMLRVVVKGHLIARCLARSCGAAILVLSALKNA
jgi:hypothetical protein